ncbi:hypothetical protein [Polaribacter sp.]|uniref:hypothetical protein n=1 Tax=Polaribacter sp. TaxID=1920175 RepID=UPI0025EA3DE9|nr:hypothetical protein [Polaribacter sp.]
MTPEEHYKEVVKLDIDKFDKKARKFDYYDLLDFAESYYKKKLTLIDVVKSFYCDDESECNLSRCETQCRVCRGVEQTFAKQ